MSAQNPTPHNINVNKIENNHVKLEGVQKVNKQDIEKLLDRAQKMPITQDGDFVKLQNYVFKVDVIEEDDDVLKDGKKGKKAEPMVKDVKKVEVMDAKKRSKQPKKQVVESVQIVSDNKIVSDTKMVQSEKPVWIEIEPRRAPVTQDEDNDDIDIDYEQIQQLEEEEEEEEEEIQSNKSLSTTSQKKYQSQMACLMEDMLAESNVEQIREIKKSAPKPKVENSGVTDFENQEKQYLKTITLYQKKIKRLNEQLAVVHQAGDLPTIAEEKENEVDVVNDNPNDESFQNELNSLNDHHNIYEEFFRHDAIESQFKKLASRDEQKVRLYQEQLETQQQTMESMKRAHERQVAEMQQQYLTQMNQMKKKMERYESYAVTQVEGGKQEQSVSSNISGLVDEGEYLSDLGSFDSSQVMDEVQGVAHPDNRSISSGIGSLISQNEMEEFKEIIKRDYRPYYRNDSSIGDLVSMESGCLDISSNIGNENENEEFSIMGSSTSGILADDSELGRDFLRIQQQPHLKQQDLNDMDSSVGDLISNLDINSDISSMNYVDSSIGSIVSDTEVQELRRDPLFMQQSNISFMDDELLDSVTSNHGDFCYDPNSTLYQQIALQLERDYSVPLQDKLDIYKNIMNKAKQQYESQLVQMRRSSTKTLRIQNQSSISKKSSVVGLSLGSISKGSISKASISIGSISMGSSIGSIMSQNERSQLQKQLGDMGSNINNVDSFNSSIGSVISRGAQNAMQNDSKYSRMNSDVQSYKSFKSGISANSSKKSIFNFMKKKRDSIVNISDDSIRQKYNNFIGIRSRDEQLKDISSSIGSYSQQSVGMSDSSISKYL